MAQDKPVAGPSTATRTFRKSDIQKQWLERVQAVGRAQARYFWIMLVSGVFFCGLRYSAEGASQVTVPVINLKLDASAVLASGPFLLSLLVVATVGTMRAWRDALIEYAGDDWEEAAARLDRNPIVFDFALYAARGRRLLKYVVFAFGYTTFLTVVVVEAVWLLWWLTWSSAPGKTIWIVIAAPFLLGAVQMVLAMWGDRFARAHDKWQAEKQSRE